MTAENLTWVFEHLGVHMADNIPVAFATGKFVPIPLKQKTHLCGGSARALLEEAGGSDRMVSVAEGINTPSVPSSFQSQCLHRRAIAGKPTCCSPRWQLQLISAASCEATRPPQLQSKAWRLLPSCSRAARGSWGWSHLGSWLLCLTEPICQQGPK